MEQSQRTHVELAQIGPAAPTISTANSDSNGRFNFPGVPPGAFRITVSSIGFASQVVSGVLHPGESFEPQPIVLLMAGTASEVRVTASTEEIAQEQVKEEETQRVLGVIPNFYVSYVPNAAPLSSRQKFDLAWKSSIDPISFLTAGAFAGVQQANNSFPGYGQGAQGYGKRFGADFADNFIGSMIGSALLPVLFKQDPHSARGDGNHPIARTLCHRQRVRLQRRQRALAAKLFRGTGRARGWRHLEPLLPRQRPRWLVAHLRECPGRHGRGRGPEPDPGVCDPQTHAKVPQLRFLKIHSHALKTT